MTVSVRKGTHVKVSIQGVSCILHGVQVKQDVSVFLSLLVGCSVAVTCDRRMANVYCCHATHLVEHTPINVTAW